MNDAMMARTRSISAPSSIALVMMCVAIALAASGCASLLPRGGRPTSAPPGNGSSSVLTDMTREKADVDEHDPWQRFNETMFEFNRRLDTYALRPVAKGWKAVVPERVELMLSNAFDNLTVVPRVLNNALQAKWDGAGRELGRFVINSTAGVGGLFDPATAYLNVAKSPADFGQTLGTWGAGPGPYLVLPFMDPLTVRDGAGRFVDFAMDPLSYVLPLVPVRFSLMAGSRVNERALSDDLLQDLEDSVLDPYSAVRNGYLQRRERMIHDQEEPR
jgi:phospholipid-binding lipoprotein MlaA